VLAEVETAIYDRAFSIAVQQQPEVENLQLTVSHYQVGVPGEENASKAGDTAATAMARQQPGDRVEIEELQALRPLTGALQISPADHRCEIDQRTSGSGRGYPLYGLEFVLTEPVAAMHPETRSRAAGAPSNGYLGR